MATNVSYANTGLTTPSLESLVLHILPHQTDLGDGILNHNGLTAALNSKGTTEEIDGGLEAWCGVIYAESSNAKWQGRNDDMLANSQDPAKRLSWQWAIFTNSVVINDLDKAMCKGRAMVKPLLETLRRQAKSTNENQFNSAFWKSSPGSDEPNSIPSLFPTANTTGTIGGLSRVGATYLQHGVDTTTVASIGAAAGVGAIMAARLNYAVGQSLADLFVISNARYAALAGWLHSLQRYTADTKLAQLEIPSIQIGDMTVIYENRNVLGGANTIGANDGYGLNSDYLWVKVLKDMNGKWETTAERVNRTLNKAVYYSWAGQMVTNCPRAHFKMTAITG